MPDNNQETTIAEKEALPIENPQMEMGNIVQQMSNESYVNAIEEAAKYAKRVEHAMQTLLVAVTQPNDWKEFAGKACLSSAGAERYMKHFCISLINWTCTKETINDDIGQGYRYIFTCDAIWNGRQVKAEGRYGTRDKFLGYADDAWRDTTEINENHIANAAKHVCTGNAIKTLLGLRGYDWKRLQAILIGQGEDTSQMSGVSFNQGSQGGTSESDRQYQADIARWLEEMYQGDINEMKKALIEATTFKGSDGQDKYCDSIKKLKGKWLGKTHHKIKEAYAAYSNTDEGRHDDDSIPY